MELRHIRYFLVVSEELNFTKAAEKLMIAQPPLSRQIKDLEDELGTQLFVRKPRGLQLTEAGMRFKEYAGQILHLAERSAEDIREMNRGLQGTLYMATVEGVAPRMVSKWIQKFHEAYPHVQYNLWNGNSDDVSGRVMNGLCDMAVITAPYDQESLEGVEVFSEPWIAMIPGDHPLAKMPGDSIDLIELAPYDLIIPSRQSRLNEIAGWFTPLGVKPKVICRIAHMLNAYELTARGLGIAIYPNAASSYTSGDEVVIKKLSAPSVQASYVLVRNAERTPSTVAKEFWEFVMDNFIEEMK